MYDKVPKKTVKAISMLTEKRIGIQILHFKSPGYKHGCLAVSSFRKLKSTQL